MADDEDLGANLLQEEEPAAITDDEFCDLYNNRKPSDLASDDLLPKFGIITWLLVTGEASRVTLESASQQS